MKITIAPRDKRMLLILAGFFAALGYYYLALAPAYQYSEKTAANLGEKKSELEMRTVETGHFASWRGYHDKLGAQIAGILGSLKAPAADAPVAARIAAVMDAANQAGMNISDIKPVPVSIAVPGQPPVEEIRKFMLNGTCPSTTAFFQFLQGVYGMKIDRFNLTTHGEGGGLHFTLQLESLPKTRNQIVGLENFKTTPEEYKLEFDLFSAKNEQRVKTAKEMTPDELRAMKEKQFQERIDALKLEGIVRVAGLDFAIVKNPDERDSIYSRYQLHDQLRGSVIAAIKDEEVWFVEQDERIGCALGFNTSRILSSQETTSVMTEGLFPAPSLNQ